MEEKKSLSNEVHDFIMTDYLADKNSKRIIDYMNLINKLYELNCNLIEENRLLRDSIRFYTKQIDEQYEPPKVAPKTQYPDPIKQ